MTDTETTTTEVVWQTYLPEGVDSAPTNVEEALVAGRALLAEEGRWVQGKWFENADPTVDPDTPFCNSWKVCAEGAISSVVIGCAKRDTVPYGLQNVFEGGEVWGFKPDLLGWAPEAAQKLYNEAVHALSYGQRDDRRGTQASNFNDTSCKTRQDVLDWFDKAIACERARKANEAAVTEAQAAFTAASDAYSEVARQKGETQRKLARERDEVIRKAREAFDAAYQAAQVEYRVACGPSTEAQDEAWGKRNEARNVIHAIEAATASGQVYTKEQADA